MKPEVIAAKRTYRNRHPKKSKFGFVADRMVMDIKDGKVRYDSPDVEMCAGKWMSLSGFAKWANEDVTDQLPKDEWEEFDIAKHLYYTPATKESPDAE